MITVLNNKQIVCASQATAEKLFSIEIYLFFI